ncbi:MAG: 2-oxo acid dehydrogenase subunit E2 [Minicystis sp.]
MPLFRRGDGDYVEKVPAYRRIMPFIMPTRTESAVYFEQKIDATNGVAYIARWNERHPDQKITFLHLMMYGAIQSLHERPRLNRFTMGGHLYQRRGIWVSYSAKKAFNDDSPIVVVKQKFDPSMTFAQMVAEMYGSLKEGRSDKKSHVDKELDLFLKAPAPVLRAGVSILRWLDSWNLLPHGFIEPDPMYSSLFIANLGSVKLDSAYHHLYEYGTIPLFGVLGRLQDAVVPGPDGTVRVRPQISVKWSYDERVDDGLYAAQSLELVRRRMEDPQQWCGPIEPALGAGAVVEAAAAAG